MAIAKMSSKGWIVIPSELRRKYGLLPGRNVSIVEWGGALTIRPVPDDPIEAAYGMLAHLGGRSLTQTIVDEHRWELEREEANLPPPRP